MVSNTQTDTLFWVFCCSSCAICACQYKVQTVSVWHHPPVVYLCFWRALPLLGVLSLKFPEAPTVKSTCLFFVSAHTHTLTKPCNNMHFYMSHLASSVLIVCLCRRLSCYPTAQTCLRWQEWCRRTGSCWSRPCWRWEDRITQLHITPRKHFIISPNTLLCNRTSNFSSFTCSN